MNYQQDGMRIDTKVRRRNGDTHCSPSLSANEDIIGEESEQEGNVCLKGGLVSVAKAECGGSRPVPSHHGCGTQREPAASFGVQLRKSCH